VSIIWHGACTSHLNVPWSKSGKTKPAYTANSATYAAAAALIVNPHFQDLLATIGTALQGEEEEE
jgi:hypothetical protein